MKKLLVLLIFFYLSQVSFCYSSMKEGDVSLVGGDKIKLKDGGKENIYKFNFSINGYEINCLGTRMVLWGYPLKFNEGSPADNTYVLFNLIDKKMIKESLVSHGIFGVDFLNDAVSAFLDTGEGYIININTGSMSKVDKNKLNDLDNLSEVCVKPMSWSFNKFPG